MQLLCQPLPGGGLVPHFFGLPAEKSAEFFRHSSPFIFSGLEKLELSETRHAAPNVETLGRVDISKRFSIENANACASFVRLQNMIQKCVNLFREN